MEKNEIKPLFEELWKQLKVIGRLLANIGKALTQKMESSACRKVVKNPITTLVVSNSLLMTLLFISNLGWFVKYKTTVKDGDYIEMEVSKRVDQEKLHIEAEANELAFDRYQVKIDSLNQELISLKGRKVNYNKYKKNNTDKNVSATDITDTPKENKNVNVDIKKSSNGDDFVEVKE